MKWTDEQYEEVYATALRAASALADAVLRLTDERDEARAQVRTLTEALEAVRDDPGLADVIAGVGAGLPPFMHKVLDALAPKGQAAPAERKGGQ